MFARLIKCDEGIIRDSILMNKCSGNTKDNNDGRPCPPFSFLIWRVYTGTFILNDQNITGDMFRSLTFADNVHFSSLLPIFVPCHAQCIFFFLRTQKIPCEEFSM